MKKIFSSVLYLFLFFSMHLFAFTQSISNLLPAKVINSNLLENIETITLGSNLDLPVNENNKDKIFPLWAGHSIETDISTINNGTIIYSEDNQKVWLLKIHSQNAPAIGIVFQDIKVSDNARFTVYSPNYPSKYYTILGKDIVGGFLSTPPLPGETVIIAYSEEIQENIPRLSGSFTISDILFIYNGIENINETKDLGDSGNCQVNINCSPEGDNWQIHKRGVARILFKRGNSWYWCSGSLVNNTNYDGTPYFLTAEHCGGNATDTDRNVWQFYFNFERQNCENNTTPPNHLITGCILKAKGPLNGGSDFLLLQLNSRPPQEWNPYYNGWDRSETASAGGVGIHHPSGDAKKISTFTTTPTSSTPNIGGSPMATNSAWRLTWAQTDNGHGVTEGGSSGSPIFNGSGLIIGTLSGGAASCNSTSQPDYYGKFSYHWESNGTNYENQLKPWLDPTGTGVTTLQGYSPYENSTNLLVESFETTEFPPQGWVREANSTNSWQVTSGYSIGSPPAQIAPIDGSKFAFVQWHQTAAQNEWLITPFIDISSVGNPILSFWFNGSPYWSIENDNCDLKVMARQSNIEPWTQIWSEVDHPGFIGENTYLWLYTEVDLNVYNGTSNLQLAFVYQGTDGANFNIDNVKISGLDDPEQFSLTIQIEGNGIVKVNGQDYTSQITRNQGAILTLEAIADDDWYFSRWEQDLLGNQNPTSIALNSNKIVKAEFLFGSSSSVESDLTLSLYPNPFSCIVTVHSSKKYKRIRVHDILGQLISFQDFEPTNEKTFQFQTFSSGLYFISIETIAGEKIVRRIIRN